MDAWQWRPDLICFDNHSLVKTPNYYVQQLYGMNPGNDVLPLRMDGKPVAGQEQLYATAALDAATGEVILKIVNAAAMPQSVRIGFEGLKKRRIVSGTCTYLQSDDLQAVNTLDREPIAPLIRPVAVGDREVSLTLDPNFFGVYRLQVR